VVLVFIFYDLFYLFLKNICKQKTCDIIMLMDMAKKKLKALILGGVVLFGLVGAYKTVSALTYSQDIGVSFTFDSVLQVSLSSSDITIANLAPGTAADSNVVTVNVLTNNLYGYTLNASVGNSTYNTRNLVNSNSSETANFASLDYSATPTIATNTSFSPNTWGYSYSTNNGSTWANYNGLPLYSDTSNIATLRSANGPVGSTSGDNVQFKIAAKADVAQTAGEYNNVINFTLVAKPAPVTLEMAYANAGKVKGNSGRYSMQDMTTDICNAVEVENEAIEVYDARSGIYHIAKLSDHRCWMLDNLALDLTSQNIKYGMTNGSDTKTNASAESLQYLFNGGGTTADQYATAGVGTFTSSNEFSVPRIAWNGTCYDTNCVNDPSTGQWRYSSVIGAISNSSGSNKIGVYYNYCAASAGTYCWGNGTNDTGSPEIDPNPNSLIDVTEDICPKNWRMPTSTENGEYQALYSAYSSNYTDFRRALSTPLSGYYGNGSAHSQGELGYFWSSTWDYTYTMGGLDMDTSNINPSGGSFRELGFSVRCIAK